MAPAGTGVLFIGAGRMGAPMAERLRRAGVALAVADLAADTLSPFAAHGIPVASHGRDLPGAVVMTMLPADSHVRAALLGEGGACTGAFPRDTMIDLSSASPEATRALAAELAGRGIGFLDAPVSGGVAGARAGTLTAMVGGDAETFAACRPLIMHFCRRADLVGPAGSGHVVKALNNFLSAVTLWSTSEALVVGRRLGLDPAAMLAAWTAGSGRSHASEVKLPDHVLTGRYDFGQTLTLFCKDIANAQDLAEKADAATPVLDMVLAAWQGLAARIGPQGDITEVARVLEGLDRSGSSGLLDVPRIA